MVIKRVGAPLDSSSPHRVLLGRLLVTIDDLAALGDMIKSDASVSVGEGLEIGFDGGSFGDPEDMRRLSDDELRRLVIKGATVEVVLSDSGAYALGAEESVNRVYRSWARARQTRRLPARGVRKDFIVSLFVMTLLLVVMLALAVGLTLDALNPARANPLVGSVVGVVAFVGTAMWLGAQLVVGIVRTGSRSPLNYAVIVPLTRDEFRKNQEMQLHPRRGTVVAAVSVVVAVVSIAITVWLALR